MYYGANRKKRIAVAVISGVMLTLAGYIVSVYRQPVAEPSVQGAQSMQLLQEPWNLSGTKSFSEQSAQIPEGAFAERNVMKVTYDLHGLCALGGPSSAMSLSQSETKASVSLADYGTNCKDGEQSVDIPIAAFKGIDSTQKVDTISASFWYPAQYNVEIKNIVVYFTGSVLGITSDTPKEKEHKTFPDITPIRPNPYVKKN